MKRIFFFLIPILSLQACVEKDLTSSAKETSTTNLAIATKMTTTSVYKVPTVSGYSTVASYKGTVLARTSVPMGIIAPKDTENIELSYVENEFALKATSAPTTYSNLWQTVMFEDSRQGDFDYNDLIVHANYQKTGTTMTVGVQPIALGATKDIKLGFKWTQGTNTGEVILANSCRSELFGDYSNTFINTAEGHYNKHYEGFVVSKSFTVPSETEAVDITWFIEVDGNVRIYGVNQYGDKCIDASGNPYGFALTDCTVASSSAASKQLRSSSSSPSTYGAWNSVVPQINSWVKDMGDAPEVSAKAIEAASSITSAGTFKISTGSESTLSSGKATCYVQGTLNLQNWNSNSTIYVLPGGVVNVPAVLQACTIYNYGGTVNVSNGLDMSYSAYIYSNGDININGDLNIGSGNELVCHGALAAKSLAIAGNLYAGDFTCSGDVTATNNAIVYIDGKLSAVNISTNSNAQLYVDCSAIATGQLNPTSNSSISVRSYIKATTILLNASGVLNINEGGLIETGYLDVENANSAKLASKNKGVTVVAADKVHFNLSDVKNLFGGTITIVSDNVDPSVNALKLSNGVTFNGEVTLAADANGCHNGYNVDNNVDNGLAWFKFPIERTNINTCYNFTEWKNGNFDFTLLPNAKVFNINATNPDAGLKLPIYQLK